MLVLVFFLVSRRAFVVPVLSAKAESPTGTRHGMRIFSLTASRCAVLIPRPC